MPAFPVTWVTANALGWSCAVALASRYYFRPAANAAAALLLALSQWLVLRTRVPTAPWWFVSTALAWFAALSFGAPRGFLSPDPYSTGILAGVLAGALQLRLLPRSRRAFFWPLATLFSSLAGCLLATAAGYRLYDLLPKDLGLEFLAAGLAGGLLFGALSAPVLHRLLNPSPH